MATQQAFSDVFKMFGDFKAPAMDFNQIFSLQRRNFEALSAANQAMSEGIQAVSKRQAEILRSGVESALKATKDILSSGSPEAGAQTQAKFAKDLFQDALDNVRELSEMVTKSGFEAIDVLNRRAAESVEEISRVAGAPQAKRK